MATQVYRKKEIQKIDDKDVYHKDCEWTYQCGSLKSVLHIKVKQKAYTMEESLDNPGGRMPATDTSQLSTSAIPELGSWAPGQRATGAETEATDGPNVMACH